MVNGVLSLTRSGLRDWLVQRVTAIVIGVYTLFLLGFLILHADLQYTEWHALFAHPAMKIFTFVTLLSVVWHTWVGMWTVFTDYIKPTWLRLILTVLMIFALMVYLVWGATILW